VNLDPISLELEVGQGESLSADLATTRVQASEVYRFGVYGEVCLTNEGEQATQDLSIEAIVQARLGNADFMDRASILVDVSSKPVIAPGERHCYPYQVAFGPAEGAGYRVIARVSVRNDVENAKTAMEHPPAEASFSLPATPSLNEIDGEADLTGNFVCPDGFECCVAGGGDWHLTESGTLEYALKILNASAACEAHALAINATLLETGSGQEHPTSASAVVRVVGCEAEKKAPPEPKPTASPTLISPAIPAPTDMPTPLLSNTPEATSIPTQTALLTEEPTLTPLP